MKFFVRAVVSGFAFSLGAALFKKVSPHLGLEDKGKDKDKEDLHPVDGKADDDPATPDDSDSDDGEPTKKLH